MLSLHAPGLPPPDLALNLGPFLLIPDPGLWTSDSGLRTVFSLGPRP